MTNSVAFKQQNIEHIVITGPKTLDFASMVELQQLAFADIIKKTGTAYLFTEPYYRWKYSAPAGDAKIALMYDEVGLVAVNAMYPLTILADGDRIRGWQSCDTATHPRGRKKGYFTQCNGALKEKLGTDELFFGYPNHTSIIGLINLGWSHHGQVRTWANVFPRRKTSFVNFIVPIEHFTNEQDEFSETLATAYKGAMLDRSAVYMNWRYKNHPLHHYETFAWREEGRLLGLIVLRKATISGRTFAIVMETLTLSSRVERGLLAFAAHWGRENKVTCTLVLNNTLKTLTAILSAYLPVPMWALPKRQILMGTPSSGHRAQRAWKMPWYIQIGDWDGF